MQILRTFPTRQEARDYRHEHGTGGWIFSPDIPDDNTNLYSSESILFPPNMAPIDIFNHPITRGRSGDLIGNA